MFEITKRFTFEAAHQLPWHGGKCKNLHGHSYKLEVTLGSQGLTENGIVIDFDILSAIVENTVTKRYDHKLLNDFLPNPTAELLAVEIWRVVAETLRMNQLPVDITKVKLWETEKCSVTVTDLA